MGTRMYKVYDKKLFADIIGSPQLPNQKQVSYIKVGSNFIFSTGHSRNANSVSFLVIFLY